MGKLKPKSKIIKRDCKSEVIVLWCLGKNVIKLCKTTDFASIPTSTLHPPQKKITDVTTVLSLKMMYFWVSTPRDLESWACSWLLDNRRTYIPLTGLISVPVNNYLTWVISSRCVWWVSTGKSYHTTQSTCLSVNGLILMISRFIHVLHSLYGLIVFHIGYVEHFLDLSISDRYASPFLTTVNAATANMGGQILS